MLWLSSLFPQWRSMQDWGIKLLNDKSRDAADGPSQSLRRTNCPISAQQENRPRTSEGGYPMDGGLRRHDRDI